MKKIKKEKEKEEKEEGETVMLFRRSIALVHHCGL